MRAQKNDQLSGHAAIRGPVVLRGPVVPKSREATMSPKRWSAAIGIMAACIAFQAAAADVPDLERGRALYENHCIVCHTSKVHRRIPRSAIDMDALRYIVKVWVEEQNLRWSPEDIEDVVQYLDSTHYNFDK